MIKRIILIAICLLLVYSICTAERPVITSGTVETDGILISAANSTSFIDVDTSKTGASVFSTAIKAAVVHNDVIEITSITSKQKIFGFAKAVGSGTNNLGTEINTGTLPANKLYLITATEANHFGTGLELGEYFTSLGTETCDANNKVQQVVAPSADGVTITNTPGGSTYNFGLSSVTPATFFNDAAGYTYRIISRHQYGALIQTETITSGTLHIATVNGGAMFFHDTINFSSYAGNDSGNTLYIGVFYDSLGNSTRAFLGAVGGGEALGGEIITGTLTEKTLYKITATETDHFGTGLAIGSYFTSAGTETCDTYNKVQAVTDVLSTGLHLISTKNGNTRNMTYEETRLWDIGAYAY